MDGWEIFNKVAYWMLKIAYINLLWILFTFVGLIVFGVFPSTIAMFTIVRKWLKRERHIRIFHTFWNVFRQEFLEGNGFAIIFLFIGYFLYFDIMFLQLNQGKMQFLYPVLIFILIAYIMTLLYFFPVYVHFRLGFFHYIKQSFLIAVAAPLETLQIGIAIILMYIIVTYIPGIIPLFPGSALAVAITWISYRALTKIERRKQKYQT